MRPVDSKLASTATSSPTVAAKADAGQVGVEVEEIVLDLG